MQLNSNFYLRESDENKITFRFEHQVPYDRIQLHRKTAPRR